MYNRRKPRPKHPEEGVSAARQVELLDSIPGIAIVSAATLVLGTQGIARFVSGKALSAQWASCPERTQTGTSLNKTHLTARGDHKQRAMLYLVTQTACNFDPAFAFHKWRMIQRGLCPQQAVCAMMNKMAHVIWALVARNQMYDVNRMIEQIRIHHAGLWKTFVSSAQGKPCTLEKSGPRTKENCLTHNTGPSGRIDYKPLPRAALRLPGANYRRPLWAKWPRPMRCV